MYGAIVYIFRFCKYSASHYLKGFRGKPAVAGPGGGRGGGGKKKNKKKIGGGGGPNFFFFFAPPPRARERAELSDENTGPSS